ncbi:MAG: DNA primase [Mariniblastus sp.]|nr:DNA primase [Mariniblastus sp.]
MSNLPDFDLKDRVKRATDVVDLIGTELNLRQRGATYYGHCPWHDDQSPSFQVNQNKQTWVCYPCDIRGDVFDFVMKREGVNFREALEILAERANIPITRNQKKFVKGSKDDKQVLYRAMQWAEEEYHQCLLQSDAAMPVREYLQQRGITQESIETFKIGFAPLSWSWLVDRSRNTPYSPEILEACGLVSANQRGSWYERFRGRVLFPIRDTQERAIALGGRVIPGLYGEGQEPKGKYVNSPETRLFSKSRNLYALNLARGYLQKTSNSDKRLTIVEGYTDVVAAWQAGLQNVVAALGVALNEQHIRLIKRFADGITLVLDGDEAGLKTMNTVLDLFVAHDIDLRILALPDGMDPFDFLMKNGGGPFRQMVENAPDAIAHKILVETKGIDLVNDTHQANRALENVLATLAKIPASVIQQSAAKSMRQHQIVMRLARQFQLPPEQVRLRLSELRSNIRPSFQQKQESTDSNAINYAKFNLNEAALIELLIQDPSLLDRAVENIAPTQLEPGLLRELYEVMGECFHEGVDVSYQQLMLELEVNRLRDLVNFLYDKAISKKESTEGTNAYVLDLESQMDLVIASFNKKLVESGKRAKISQLHQPNVDEQEKTATLEEIFQQKLQQELLKIKKTK